MAVTRLLLIALAFAGIASAAWPQEKNFESRRSPGPNGHQYRFVVQDPQREGRPYRGPFQAHLASKDEVEGQSVFRGHTDARGRTPWMHTAGPQAFSQWRVTPVVGAGPYGLTFNFTAGEPSRPVPGLVYLLVPERSPLYCGFSDAWGDSVRLQSPHVENVSTYQAYNFKQCLRFVREMNRIQRLPPSSRVQALLGFDVGRYNRDIYVEITRVIGSKQLLAHAGLPELRGWMHRQLAAADDDQRASLLNDVGYGLVNQEPPRFPAQARDWLEQSLVLQPDNRHTLDSLGWALHREGRHEDALRLIERSLIAYGRHCAKSELAARQITLAHRGHVLQALGRAREALQDWATASAAGDDSRWTGQLSPESLRLVDELARSEAPSDLCQVVTRGTGPHTEPPPPP